MKSEKRKNMIMFFSVFVFFTGVVVLIGWQFEIALFTSISPGFIAMNPTTAFSFLCIGAWLQLSIHNAGSPAIKKPGLYTIALMVMLIGLVRSTDFLFDTGIQIDTILYSNKLAGNRMSLPTAINLWLVGMVMLMLTKDRRRFVSVANSFIGFSFFITLLSLCLYVIQDDTLYIYKPFAPMALHTCVVFLFVSIGLFPIHVKNEFIIDALSKKVGGLSLHVFVPYTILFSFVIAFLRYKGEQAGFFDTGLGVSIMAVSTICIALFILSQAAVALSKAERKRRQLQLQMQKAKQVADSASVYKSRFLASMNHELRTPLNGILGFTEVLSDSSLSDDQQHYLNRIRYSGTVLAKSIEDILNEEHKTEENEEDTVEKNSEIQTGATTWRGLDKSISVLVVEDNLINQELVGFILKKNNIHYEIANNGKEAVDIIRSQQFDMVLMDIDMPVMNGMDATREIRETLCLDVPIIALTASLGADDIEDCLKAGMNEHLGKPYTEEQLLKTIRQHHKTMVAA